MVVYQIIMVTFVGHASTLGAEGLKLWQEPTPEAERVLDMEVVEQGLKMRASPQQKIEGLIEAGLHVPVLAESIGVKDETVEKWLESKSTPMVKSQQTINSIRMAMRTIIESGVNPERAAVWMQSPVDEEKFPYVPMEIISEKPEVVRKAVNLFFERPA